MTPYLVGLDVGSTTVKTVVVSADSGAIVSSTYERHGARPAETTLAAVRRLERDLGLSPDTCRLFVTGSGGQSLAASLGGRFVQEVTAVAAAVEQLHPDVGSVIELGGQDAKIILFKRAVEGGAAQKIVSMNDKCAGGTGAVIDKIAAKLGIHPDDLGRMGYDGIRRHRVAGKCGVFAETDINGLQKSGVREDELMASLFEALVLQNLTVLARGHTLRPRVLLLGGPNAFIRGMREAWQDAIPRMWDERHVAVPDAPLADLIRVPDNALFYAALGAVVFGRTTQDDDGRFAGVGALERYVATGRHAQKLASGSPALVQSQEEASAFCREFAPPSFVPAVFAPGSTVRAFAGLDGGSTSTKAVLLSEEGDVLAKAYQLSTGNPIEDTIDVFTQLRRQVEDQGAALEILGVGTTGYAKDMLHDILQADVALVETVAHAESALRTVDDPHVIVDVGGQDIKIIVLRDGRVTDFRLNTQCSAGNGYFLQATAQALGVPLDGFADVAFSARAMPVFGFGCAVFLQADIVNFQRDGWSTSEILAGLAAVLPKNIFLYVANTPNLARLGRRFVLQGGTQRNLSVVKAEVDFIRASFRESGVEPEIVVHEHCGEAGAIGAAVEAHRLWADGRATTFIGLDALAGITYRTTASEQTRCRFCKNACLRTFIDFQVGAQATAGGSTIDDPPSTASRVPLPPGARRLIVAGCEKGTVEDVGRMRTIKAGLDAAKQANPNLVEAAAHDVWRPRHPARVADPVPSRVWLPSVRRRREAMTRRSHVRIGMPRVLYQYVYAPFFNGYFESLGVDPDNLVYSDFTSDEMYRAGSSRGSIDPCFPSKIALSHTHNLIHVKHARRPLDYVFFPMIDSLHSCLVGTRGQHACPTVASTPQVVKAAFTKEADLFAEQHLTFVSPILSFADRPLLERQLLDAWAGPLGLSEAENVRAVETGHRELEAHERALRAQARDVLAQLERDDRLGIVLLGRPYHHDSGINHEILSEFQKRGYPVFSQSTLPLDPDLLGRLFGDEVRDGTIGHPLEIGDVWKNSFSASTNHKLWAAKFVARHPNLVALEISSFKCGHDAPVFSVVQGIIEQSGTPYFCFKDVDENRPTGAIKIRVETIAYALDRYQRSIQAGTGASSLKARSLKTATRA
jgi:activator of 2-hydroxyglutaryl-CoA dehydratase/predicted nucleotide-binding protein (sugar kinase/HSP70/actin superfamily)